MMAAILYGSKERIFFIPRDQKKMAAPTIWEICNEGNNNKRISRQWETSKDIELAYRLERKLD